MGFSKVKFLGKVNFFENRAVIARDGTIYFNGNITFMNNSLVLHSYMSSYALRLINMPNKQNFGLTKMESSKSL